METADEQLRGIVIGDYQMLKPIGRGAFASVYLAEHQQTKQRVAVKILPDEIYSDKTVVDRFLREVHLTSQMNHPNIVKVFELFDFEGMHCYAMEYVPGGSLGELLSHGPMDEEQAVRMLKQVCEALKYAHAAGVIHRDVKPDNLLLAENGDVKLCDLGLAQAKNADGEANLTVDGFTVGTPNYMSPEQIRGDKNVDWRADLYGLGATMYHMLTGLPPFAGGSSAEIMSKHLNEPVPSPKRVNFRISNEICYVVKRMMAKRREDRYSEWSQLFNDLGRVERRYEEINEGASSVTPPPIKIDEEQASLVTLNEGGEAERVSPTSDDLKKEVVRKIFDDSDQVLVAQPSVERSTRQNDEVDGGRNSNNVSWRQRLKTAYAGGADSSRRVWNWIRVHWSQIKACGKIGK